MNPKLIFHYISYLQYPMMLVAMIFLFEALITGKFIDLDYYLEAVNNTLIFMGLGISFSSLQDTDKTQNKLSKKVWQDPVKGKRFLIIMGFFTALLIIAGLCFYFIFDEGAAKTVSIGIFVLGIGMVGLLKAAMEMFEKHRTDKNPL